MLKNALAAGGEMVVTKIIEPLRGPPRKLPLDKTFMAA